MKHNDTKKQFSIESRRVEKSILKARNIYELNNSKNSFWILKYHWMNYNELYNKKREFIIKKCFELDRLLKKQNEILIKKEQS
jgi:hypothetical protein